MRHIGIDPGATGAIATIRKGKVRFYRIPRSDSITAGRKVKDYDLPACHALLKRLVDKGKCIVCLEKVNTIFWMSKVACFSMGRSRGLWEGICASLGIVPKMVPPATWKNELFGKDALKKARALRKKKKGLNQKQSDIALAKKLYPECAKKIGNNDGFADALLIAEYARRKFK